MLIIRFDQTKAQNQCRKAPLYQLLKKNNSTYNRQVLITFKDIDRCLGELIIEDFHNFLMPIQLKTEAVEDFLVGLYICFSQKKRLKVVFFYKD
jgi:hypothetical protein